MGGGGPAGALSLSLIHSFAGLWKLVGGSREDVSCWMSKVLNAACATDIGGFLGSSSSKGAAKAPSPVMQRLRE